MNNVHIKRFNLLVDYIENCKDEEIHLKRKEIANIVKISEGDSLKKIFVILNQMPDIYEGKFTYTKKNKDNIFNKKKENVLKIFFPQKINNIDHKTILDNLIKKNEKFLNILKIRSKEEYNAYLNIYEEEFKKINKYKHNETSLSTKEIENLKYSIKDMNDLINTYLYVFYDNVPLMIDNIL